MERSNHHMRVHGPARVEEHGVKIATIAPLESSEDPAELAESTVAVRVDGLGGEYSLVQSQFFIVAAESTGESSSAAVDHGARFLVVRATLRRFVRSA